MFYVPWFGLITLAGTLIIGGLVIYVLAQVLAKHPAPEWRKRNMLKHIYLYLILFMTLMMTIGGSIGVFAGIANFVSPPYYADTYEQFKQQRCDNSYMTPYKSSTEDNGTEPTEAELDEIEASEDAEASVSSDRSYIQPWPYPGAKYCDEGELRDAYDRMIRDLEDDAKSDAIRSIIQSLGWIIVPLPVFIFFQRQLHRKTTAVDDTTTKKEE